MIHTCVTCADSSAEAARQYRHICGFALTKYVL